MISMGCSVFSPPLLRGAAVGPVLVFLRAVDMQAASERLAGKGSPYGRGIRDLVRLCLTSFATLFPR